jgi:hypothetical protein
VSVSEPKHGLHAYPEGRQHRIASAATSGTPVAERPTNDRVPSLLAPVMAHDRFPLDSSLATIRTGGLQSSPKPLEPLRWPCSFRMHAQSVSLQTLATLGTGPIGFREIARFHRAVDLEVGPSIVALVLPEIGNGPFHIVVDRLPTTLSGTTTVRRTRSGLTVGSWFIAITDATVVWDPRPRWESLAISERLFRRLEILTDHTTSARRDPTATQRAVEEATVQPLHGLTQALVARSADCVRQMAESLAGLGQGLTPAGDDVLAGVMLAMWAGHYPNCKRTTHHIYSATESRTNRLSRAFLKSASEGLAIERWHILLRGLSGDPEVDLEQATRQVTSFGATSGLDMLNGFVAGYRATRRRP